MNMNAKSIAYVTFDGPQPAQLPMVSEKLFQMTLLSLQGTNKSVTLQIHILVIYQTWINLAESGQTLLQINPDHVYLLKSVGPTSMGGNEMGVRL